VSGNASAELLALAEKTNIPVTTTLMALGAVPYDHPLFLGLPGMHGTYAANMALTYTDCLIAVGARFDDRVTGRVSDFAPEATIIHIEIDASEIGKIRAAHIPLPTDARQGLAALLAAVPSRPVDDWCRQVWKWRAEHPLRDPGNGTGRSSLQVIEAIWRATGGEALITTGVGQHQMWVAMAYGFRRPHQLLTSGGLGTMGYGLPAAIGAQVARPDAQVVCIDGDGSFQMTSFELATVVEQGLPVKVFIMNNACHGMVRQWQELFFARRYAASRFHCVPDFVRLAEAYGVPGMRIGPDDPVEPAVRRALEADGPVVVDVFIPQEEKVLPMVPPGAALKEMIEA
jgi:acetolactate synthase-1/2/3 large subunit